MSTGRGTKNSYPLLDHRNGMFRNSNIINQDDFTNSQNVIKNQIHREECDKRFRIIETIGEGTYGVVYKALDLTTDKVSYRFVLFTNIRSLL